MLIGADPSHVADRCIRVTIHHCFFDGTRQRHPRVRYAKVHLYNNYTRNWGIYAVCASVDSQVIMLSIEILVLFGTCLEGWKIWTFSRFSLISYLFFHQIYSQCNIYEAGQKKMAFKYLTEKVSVLSIFFFSIPFLNQSSRFLCFQLYMGWKYGCNSQM